MSYAVHVGLDCNTLQHVATRCNTLQDAVIRCNTLPPTNLSIDDILVLICRESTVAGSLSEFESL